MVGAGPPDGVHLLAREVGGLRFANGGGRHHAGRPQQHVVGALLADLQPGGFLLDARCRHGQLEQLKAFLGGALFQQRNRLLAVGRVVVNQRDLLALEAAFFLLQDVLNHRISGRPVAAQQWEVPLEHAAVGRLRQAIAHRYQRHLVAGRLVAGGKGDAGRLRVKARRAAALVLQALVAFDALGGVVRGLAFLERDLDAVDAALGVDQLQVVLLAVGPWNAQRRELAGAVDQQRDELLLCLRLNGGRRGDAAQCGDGECESAQFHGVSP